MDFKEWLSKFVEEKELDIEHEFYVEHKGNVHFIELSVVIMMCKKTSIEQQELIKKTLVKLDFYNANVMHYFEHLAKCYVQNNF